MNKKKKWLSLLLSLALLFSLCPQTVSAEEISASGQTEETCPFTITKTEDGKAASSGTDYDWDSTNKKLTITSGLTISMKDGVTTPFTAQIVAHKTNQNWDNITLTLAGVNITAPTNLGVALNGGQFTINLTGSNTLTGAAINSGATTNTCGIYASDNLTINGPGTLNAVGGRLLMAATVPAAAA